MPREPYRWCQWRQGRFLIHYVADAVKPRGVYAGFMVLMWPWLAATPPPPSYPLSSLAKREGAREKEGGGGVELRGRGGGGRGEGGGRGGEGDTAMPREDTAANSNKRQSYTHTQAHKHRHTVTTHTRAQITRAQIHTHFKSTHGHCKFRLAITNHAQKP